MKNMQLRDTIFSNQCKKQRIKPERMTDQQEKKEKKIQR